MAAEALAVMLHGCPLVSCLRLAGKCAEDEIRDFAHGYPERVPKTVRCIPRKRYTFAHSMRNPIHFCESRAVAIAVQAKSALATTAQIANVLLRASTPAERPPTTNIAMELDAGRTHRHEQERAGNRRRDSERLRQGFSRAQHDDEVDRQEKAEQARRKALKILLKSSAALLPWILTDKQPETPYLGS